MCPLARKHVEMWGGGLLLVGALVLAVLNLGVWGNLAALAVGIGGAFLVWHASRYKAPVLEVDAVEFRYRRGRYVVRIPFREVGSYYIVDGRAPSLGICGPSGQPRIFPSVEGRRARRPYLPLTGSTSRAKVEEFMSVAGIPERQQALTVD
ncbi:hypothetical protein [Spiractinospora alimapuensis]|uniref:hypothetical protein n=1 Tax=Spiractinospora alimapuensis TaxID=2820884 RepID=UPI002ED6DD0D